MESAEIASPPRKMGSETKLEKQELKFFNFLIDLYNHLEETGGEFHMSEYLKEKEMPLGTTAILKRQQILTSSQSGGPKDRVIVYKWISDTRPCRAMAIELTKIYRRQVKRNYQNTQAKKKAQKQAEQAALDEINNSVPAIIESDSKSQKNEELEQARQRVDNLINNEGELRLSMVDAALRIMNIGIEEDVMKKILWTVDYVNEKGSDANIADVVRFNKSTNDE